MLITIEQRRGTYWGYRADFICHHGCRNARGALGNCDSCGTVVDLDLRVKPRDPEASIRVALRDIQCPRCNGHGCPRIIALSEHPLFEIRTADSAPQCRCVSRHKKRF